jgi:CspA family cold shock protein
MHCWALRPAIMDTGFSKMATGIVKFFNSAKGYGFISPDDGSADVFVHIRSLRKCKFPGDPKDGDKLTFEIEDSDKGPRAENVVRVV